MAEQAIARSRVCVRLAGSMLIVATLAACVGGRGLDPNAFVGDWTCGETEVALSAETIIKDGTVENIAWIETGKNADFGLFTTKGERYSINDTRRRSMTLFDHKERETLKCTRA